MAGPLRTNCEKVLPSFPFKLKVKKPYPILRKTKSMMKVMYILNILAFETIIKYEQLQYNKSYKEVT